MSDFVRFPPEPGAGEALYLVGFRLDPTVDGPQLFTLMAMDGENDRPLIAEGRVLFFTHPAAGPAALARSDNEMTQLGQAPVEIAFLCDVAEALHVMNAQESDDEGVVLDVIGCFDDLIRATRINVPAQYMSVLSALAERFNENSEFASWLSEQGVDRETVEDAIMWCVGAIAVKSTLIEG